MRRNSFNTRSKGLYYLLGVLLLVAGMSTAVVTMLSSGGTDKQPEILDPSYGFEDQKNTQEPEPLETVEPTNEDVSSTTVKKEEPKKKETEEKTVSYPSLEMPVAGQICMEYSMEQPVFSKTLQEWRTHSGVDIEAELGTEVKAAAAGKVLSVSNDPRYGQTVIIDHGSNVKTIYSNLTEDVAVTANQEIKQGEKIGAVGDSSVFESLEASHLHFELLENNKPVDPTGFLIE